MHRFFLLGFACAIFCLNLPGCEPDEPSRSKEGESCSKTADCDDGLRCVELTCVNFEAQEKALDVETESGLLRALEGKEKLGDAMDELRSKADDPAALKPYGEALNQLFLNGSEYDREVLGHLVTLEDPAYKNSYIKAVASGNEQMAPMGAGVVAKLQINDAVEELVKLFHATADNELKRVALEVGTEIRDDKFTKLASDFLTENGPDDVPIGTLRYACRVLEHQADPNSAKVLLRAMFYVDAAGRDINKDCSYAVLAIGPRAIPDILTMLAGKDENVNAFVAKHADTMTQETVFLGATVLLGKLRATEARKPLLDALADPTPVAAPDVLVAKSRDDPAWFEWANLIGQYAQEMIFALNDIGVEKGDEEAKKILVALYRWEEPYPTKFKTPNEYINMIEVLLRVDAARVLAENDLLTDDDLQMLLTTLKDPDFDNIRKLRPAARAAIAKDLVTYLAIASKPGWKARVWEVFHQMSSNEFAEKPAAKVKFEMEPTRLRIAQVRTTYELADACKTDAACYAEVVKSPAAEDHFRRIKAAWALGRYGDHDEHFPLLLDKFGEFDVFGWMFVTDALARLGSAADIPSIEAKLSELAAVKDGTAMMFISGYLDPLKATLRSKQ